jgi:hypothetical protein
VKKKKVLVFTTCSFSSPLFLAVLLLSSFTLFGVMHNTDRHPRGPQPHTIYLFLLLVRLLVLGGSRTPRSAQSAMPRTVYFLCRGLHAGAAVSFFGFFLAIVLYFKARHTLEEYTFHRVRSTYSLGAKDENESKINKWTHGVARGGTLFAYHGLFRAGNGQHEIHYTRPIIFDISTGIRATL